MKSKVAHLVRRFIEMGRPVLSEGEDDNYAATILSDAEMGLWRRLNPVDRRHSVGVTRRFVLTCPHATRNEIAAALLHDVGKMMIYRDHERLGGRMLAEVGANPRTIELVSGSCVDEIARAIRAADDQ
jgi:lauroyl/myristoyl acyltransferase